MHYVRSPIRPSTNYSTKINNYSSLLRIFFAFSEIDLVIDISTLENYTNELEDLLDGLIAESRKNDEKVPLKDVISNLKKSGTLTSGV